jgi:hypothetical protein
MFKLKGTGIIMSRGDTGAMTISTDGYSFAAEDRADFCVRDESGGIVIHHVYPIIDNRFTVAFRNEDTEGLEPGEYSWEARFLVHPYYDGAGTIVNANQIVSMGIKPFTILPVVHDI